MVGTKILDNSIEKEEKMFDYYVYRGFNLPTRVKETSIRLSDQTIAWLKETEKEDPFLWVNQFGGIYKGYKLYPSDSYLGTVEELLSLMKEAGL